MTNRHQDIDPEKIDTSILMLRTYMDGVDLEPLISALEGLKDNPDNVSQYENISAAFHDLGAAQGAVLTYAPYIGFLVADDILNDYL